MAHLNTCCLIVDEGQIWLVTDRKFNSFLFTFSRLDFARIHAFSHVLSKIKRSVCWFCINTLVFCMVLNCIQLQPERKRTDVIRDCIHNLSLGTQKVWIHISNYRWIENERKCFKLILQSYCSLIWATLTVSFIGESSLKL